MTGKARTVDPLTVFRLICETGHQFAAARELNYAKGTLRAIASTDAKAGRYAMQFALDAGKYIYEANRTRRLAGLPEMPFTEPNGGAQ